MTAADELRTAAAKLRSTCTQAAPGPWTIAKVPPFTDPVILSRYKETPKDGEVLVVGSIDVEPEDQAAIQLLHPGVGLALADWLESTADYATVSISHPTHVVRAMAVARAINGTTTESEEQP